MSPSNPAAISQLALFHAAGAAAAQPGRPSKTQDAAQQFESLLLTQILHSAHDKDSGWLGSGADSSASCATDYAEEQLAAALSQQGGLGLAKMIAANLDKAR